MAEDTRAVRATEALDWPRLAAWLRQQLPSRWIPGLDFSCDIEVAQFPGGHSNLTYLVRLGQTELVVRRPPFGPVAPTAHDMAREYRWLSALHPFYPLAPKPFLLCEDTNVIGSVFYVMERRKGLVVRHEEPAEVANPTTRRRVSQALVDAMADLHALDVSTGPLSILGKPAGFVGRQVRGWTERWQRSKIDELPTMDELARWLQAHMPRDPIPTIVHGDFKLDNVMLDERDAGRLVAVFDWEMSALGDPLVDVGILLAYWGATAPPGLHDALSPVTHQAGWFTRDEILDRYAARSGRDVSGILFYETFALFKIAVVIQQIFYRYRRGQTDDPRFAAFGDRVTFLARQAAALAARA
jgi:aminoglycoside phosphotransferase (APT) family kinase protein